ncbi:MAG: hypothetical protein MH204_01435 [Fimbriimonadaceae bacterium]|nr:hypothetical protein [Fimbriimonadaceae bacterium]
MIVESYEDVIVLSGALTRNSWKTMQTAIQLTLKRHPTGVILDCSGLTEATMAGVTTFADVFRFVQQKDEARVVLAAVPSHVLEVIRDTPDVCSQLPIVDTVNEARRSLDIIAQAHDVDEREQNSLLKGVQYQVLCVLQGSEHDMDVVVLTRELVNNIRAKVVVLLPLVVGRDLPLTAPLPDLEEREAQSAILAKEVFTECRTACEVRMERTRDLPSLLQDVSEEINAAYCVLAVPDEDRLNESRCTEQMRQVLARVKSPVCFVRGHAAALE